MKKSKTMPKLIVYREKEWVNMAEAYELYVNNEKMAELVRGNKKVIKLKNDEVILCARMPGGYASDELNIKAKKGQTVKLKVSGFKFQKFILPYFGFSIPVYALLREMDILPVWVVIALLIPAGAYAFYYYVLRPDRSLRIEVLN
jgi:hypothetical protein